MNLHHKRILLLGCMCILFALFAEAQQQPVITATPLIGDSVKVGKKMLVRDSIYFDSGDSAHIRSTNRVDNILAIYINEFTGKIIPDTFRVTVRVQLNYTNSGGSGTRLDTLTIFYSKNHTYNSKAYKIYQGYYSLEAEILAVDITGTTDTAAVRRAITMENMLSINRNFTTVCSVVSSVDSDTTGLAATGELTATWEAQEFIPAYDLQWTYLDSSAVADGNYTSLSFLDPYKIFKNNYSSVIVTGNSYKIPLLYDGHGFLYFRVRTVQYAPDGEAIFGEWSTGTSNLGSFEFMGHERPLNWQATTSFAEEGKRKSVVQYFDGSLKGRQTVTKDNTTQTTVVAETLYDKQGRPAIQVLPSPTLSSLIAYKKTFNVNDVNSGEYDKTFYDTLIYNCEYCDSSAAKMGTASGAAQYYSSSNPQSSLSYYQYIPDAEKYPFAETRYTRDNTGRIDRQGGVGDSMQIGRGHETRYFYGSAQQKELDALFGTEAGYASHYEKNMVRDANGQYSVSYVDMHGRTVATALAGNAPATLTQLGSYNSVSQTDQLLNPVNNVIKDNSIQSNSSLLVSKAGTYAFNYLLKPESLGLTDCKDSTVCYDCLYDLTITIANSCDSTPLVITRRNFSLFKSDSVTHNLDTTCAAIADSIVVDTTLTLNEGNYEITKVLTLSRDAMQYYRDSIFMSHNTCRTFAQLVTEQLDSIRSKLDCTPDTLTTNLVNSYRDQMIADLVPLTGQYAQLDTTHSCFSIFSKSGSGIYRYKTMTGFTNEDGDPDKVSHYDGTDFVEVDPQDLDPEEFIANFKESWGDALLPLHPEYDLLVEYNNLVSAYNWEADFFKTETYADALAKGYLNPLGRLTPPANRFAVSGRTDSLFASLTSSDPSHVSTAKDEIENAMMNYVQRWESGPYFNLWGVSTALVKCPSRDSSCYIHWSDNANSFNADSLCAGDLDQAWRMFRSQYLTIRENWIDVYTRSRSGVSSLSFDTTCKAVFPYRSLSGSTQYDKYGGYTGSAADTTRTRNNADSFYLDNCRAYAKKWIEDLAPCGYTTSDYDSILPRLIQVCKEGADVKHPFGSSTVKPGSSNTFKSFEEVINDYNSRHPEINTDSCTAYLIPRPQRYDQPGMITNLPVITVPDSCTCSKINDLYFQFVSDSSRYHTFSTYLHDVHGTTISQGALDTLRSLCGGDTACRYLQNPILLPPALQCNSGSTCADCDKIRTLYDSFTVKFPQYTPTIVDEDSTRLGNEIFANFMNQHLGFSKQAYEYLQFLDSCPAPTGDCDSSIWVVFNPGTNFAINADLYANAVNNIPPYGQFFSGGYFNSPTTEQATHYVLVNKRDSIPASTNTLIMQWRVKVGADSKMADPFIRRGAYVTYVGASWIKDPSDTTWYIGSTPLPGTDGTILKGIGLTSNSHGLKADWVKIINPSTSALLYFHDFTSAGSCNSGGPFLCGQQPADSVIQLNMSECQDTTLFATQNATQLFNLYRQKLKGSFEKAYSRKCMDAGKLESFTVTHLMVEYHYTLYYYDQGGNLVKTVPPEGVHYTRDTAWVNKVARARAVGDTVIPQHTLTTTYRYNSLNQVISQHSPDGGLSTFFYDRLGRLVVSQNAKQKIDTNYSYTLYDNLGRITEVGQKKQTTQITDAISRNQSSLNSWLNYTYTLGGSTVIAEQVTATVYDTRDPELSVLPSSGFVANPAFQKQYTLRNRVSFTRFYEKLGWNGSASLVSDYDNSSIYSYDIHGNVDTLLHHYRTGMMARHTGVNYNQFKAIAYQYDLISGKVNQVHYQPGMPDQLYHRYEYDAENRLTDVYITDRKENIGIPILEEHDARYAYYKHGPLARTVLGQQLVQGIDYQYTIQGWLKGVNGDTLLDTDGSTTAIDAYRFSLNYFNGEYKAIGSSVKDVVFAGHSSQLPSGDYRPLFNGNIASMVVAIPKLGETKLYNYAYDQLNRLVKMDAYTGYNTSTHTWGTLDSHSGEYKERIAYDANGNILKYLRNGSRSEVDMDSLTYHYNYDVAGNLSNNKLLRVRDLSTNTSHYADNIGDHTVDIDDQPVNNYDYDAIGNLIKDSAEHIRSITWTVYGKIKSIVKSDGPTINYTYDVGGNRISKSVITGGDTTTTWYVRDAQGNPMGIYTGSSSTLTLSEHHLYGSSRLGVWNRNVDMLASINSSNNIFSRGNKFFELTNHLGNVLVSISDKKFGHDVGSGVIDYYNADVVNANDYYPFGMLQPGRKFSAGGLYRYGFNGKENDNDVKGEANQQDYGMRIYDPRLGRFLSVDPIAKSYPELTPYQFASNRPLDGIDLDGLEYLRSVDSKIDIGLSYNSFNKGISGIIVIDKSKVTYATQGYLEYGELMPPDGTIGSDRGIIASFESRQYSVHNYVAEPKTPEMTDADRAKSLTESTPQIQNKDQRNSPFKKNLSAGNRGRSGRIQRLTGQNPNKPKTTGLGASSSARLNAITAMIEAAGIIGEKILATAQRADFKAAIEQLSAAKKAISDVQFALNTNIFAPSDMEHLNQYANYILDGQLPTKWVDVMGKNGQKTTYNVPDYNLIKRFDKISSDIAKKKAELSQRQCSVCTNP